jgi:hypothetical protein
MADRNWNFMRDSISDHHGQRLLNKTTNHQERFTTLSNNNITGGDDSTIFSPIAKKEGLYAKKENSNYQRFVDYPTDSLTKEPKKESKDNLRDQPLNEQKNCISIGRNNQFKKRSVPLVGWLSQPSPILSRSSLEDTASNNKSTIKKHEVVSVPIRTPESSSKHLRTDRNKENTKNLNGIVNEKGVLLTSGLIINKSIGSFSQETDLSLTLSPNLEYKDLNHTNYESTATVYSEKSSLTPTETSQSLPNFNLSIMSSDKHNKDLNHQNNIILNNRDNAISNRDPNNEKTQGILIKRQYSESESNTIHNSVYCEKNQFQEMEKDSIDGSDTMLEIYDDADSENSTSISKKPKIPDGGWGWVVVVSSLVISMIADGVSFSFGLLYIEFLYEFEASKSTTAWIGSLFMAVPLLSGPIMSALVDRYGCRKMTIAGGIISGTGFVLSSYAHSIGVMYLTFGVLAGLGLGLCYVTAVVSIAFWFDKKRTLAVGLGACGTGIGTFVYAPMTTCFIEEYGWRGCVLLLSGTFFNMIVCGTVMRDPEWWIQEQKKQQGLLSPKKSQGGIGNKSQDEGRSQNSPIDEDFPGVEELRRLMKSGKAPEYLLQNLRTTTETRYSPGGNPAFRSVVNLPTFVRQSEKVRNK